PNSGPLIRAWKEAEPQSYQAFLARLSAGAEAGQDRGALVDAARAQMMPAAKPRFLHLDDVQTLQWRRARAMNFTSSRRPIPRPANRCFWGPALATSRPISMSMCADARCICC